MKSSVKIRVSYGLKHQSKVKPVVVLSLNRVDFRAVYGDELLDVTLKIFRNLIKVRDGHKTIRSI